MTSAKKRIYIGGLDPKITEDELQDRFKSFATITECEFPTSNTCDTSYAFLTMESSMAIFNGTKWKGRVLSLQEANEPKYTVKLERERIEERAHLLSIKEKRPIVSKKTLKGRAVQLASDMSLVKKQRKGWVNCKHNRLVIRMKMRMPSTGRETVIDPLKYQFNWKRFNVPLDEVKIENLHFTNDHLQDLSRDALGHTSENSRKRAGIWNEQEIQASKRYRKEYLKQERELKRLVAASGMKKKRYLASLEDERVLLQEKTTLSKIVQDVKITREPSMEGVVEFSSDDDEVADREKVRSTQGGLFDSDSDGEENPIINSVRESAAHKLSLFDDDEE